MSDGLQSYGDGGFILPDNTPAMLHFSDKFSEMDRERQKENQAKAKLEQARQQKLLSTIGDAYKYEPTGAPTDQEQLDQTKAEMEKAKQVYKQSGGDLSAVQTFVTGSAGKIAASRKAIVDFNTEIPKHIAAIKGIEGLDQAAILELAKKDHFFKTDANGNLVRKTVAEIEASPPVDLTRIIAQHPDIVFNNPNAGLEKFMGKQKLEDIGEPSVYDEKTGKRTSVGYTAKVPLEFNNVVRDPSGKPLISTKSENYKFPDGTQYFDPTTKKPVKILPDDLYKRVMENPDIALPIEAEVQKQLANDANNFNGQGTQMHGPQSEYANMLRKKIAYDKLNAFSKYGVREEADKTAENKMKIRAEQRANAMLAISQENSTIQREKYKQWKKDKDPDQPDVDFIDVLDQAYGKDVVDENGETVHMLTNLDPNDDEVIKGKTKDELGIDKVAQPATVKTKDGAEVKGWIITKDGKIKGNNDVTIDRQRVQKDALKDDAPATKKVLRRGIASKIKDGLKNLLPSGKKSSAIQGIPEGGLN